MEKIDELGHPPIIGNRYLVPCIMGKPYEIHEKIEYDEQELWMDLEEVKKIYDIYKMVSIVPIINHPHNDKENGQKEVHYHNDSRWQLPKKYNAYKVNKGEGRPISNNITYIPLMCISQEFNNITPTTFIKKSRLKYDCLHKNKCPHRGMDMSQVVEINGIIKCPLHGLTFYKETGKLTKTLNQYSDNPIRKREEI